MQNIFDGERPVESVKYAWGGWHLSPADDSLEHVEVGYIVDLKTCRTSAEVLDWIAQVSAKSWASDKVIAGLVRALDDVLDMQATLCSGGRSKKLSGAEIDQRIAALVPLLPGRLVLEPE